jgi:hypothetical protein
MSDVPGTTALHIGCRHPGADDTTPSRLVDSVPASAQAEPGVETIKKRPRTGINSLPAEIMIKILKCLLKPLPPPWREIREEKQTDLARCMRVSLVSACWFGRRGVIVQYEYTDMGGVRAP